MDRLQPQDPTELGDWKIIARLASSENSKIYLEFIEACNNFHSTNMKISEMGRLKIEYYEKLEKPYSFCQTICIFNSLIKSKKNK
jgi:hypothetical protein